MQAQPAAARKYAEQSLRYMENALKSMGQGDFDKASEFLWGGVAEAVKALASSRGLQLRTHDELWDFVRELAKELGEVEVYEAFRTASFLHTNFYEVELKGEEVVAATDSARRLVLRLLELAGHGEP